MPKPTEAFELKTVLEEFGLGQSETPGIIIPLEESFDHAPHQHYDIRTQLGNEALPVFEHKAQIIDAVRNNPVTIVVAETGAGKSTQIPQYLLDDGYEKVYVTQPRRTAARNVYLRVRDEVGQVRGSYAADDLVSYQTAGEFEGDEYAKIMVVTDGLHLVKELNDKGVVENEVLIIDEAHEWNSNVEVLIAWTKEAILKNPDLKVVIMSATIDSENLADFYSECTPNSAPPPIIEIKNRKHKVEERQEPESTVVNEVMKIANELLEAPELPEGPNGILVFEPGKREIQDAIEAIHRRLPKKERSRVKLFPLHAKLSKAEQQAALAEYPDYIKIVVSTDVAQTSLTIPDVKYVVDSGYQRRVELDHEGTPGLKLVPTSQADCKQRAGRVGRVSDGIYILTRLNEDTPFTPLSMRDAYPVPEIMRTDVARNMLRLLEIGIELSEFNMYHRASENAIHLAKENLQMLGALDENYQITPLGHRMNRYPACASSARMMVESMRYKPALRAYIAAFAAVKEAGGLQYYAQNAGKGWQSLSNETTSDLLFQLDLFITAQYMTKSELVQHGIDIDNLERAKEQFEKIALLAGAPTTVLSAPTEKEREDIIQCIMTGYTPFIYKYAGGEQYQHAYRPWPTLREISNRSVVAAGASFIIGDPYRIELGGDTPTTRQSIENVTALSAQMLGRLATTHSVLEHDEFFDQGGKFFERKRRLLFGVDIDVVEEAPAEPSPQLRQTIIEHAIANPGAAQKELRAIKSTLEHLQRIAKDEVPQLTQTYLEELIRAAAPETITRPSEIEDNLRIMMSNPESGLTLESFVSAEKQAEIEANAPNTIKLDDGSTIHIRYQNKTPLASRYSNNAVLALTEAPILPDGREVLFTRPNSKRKYHLYELQELLARANQV